jgi:hypothetical protein
VELAANRADVVALDIAGPVSPAFGRRDRSCSASGSEQTELEHSPHIFVSDEWREVHNCRKFQ